MHVAVRRGSSRRRRLAGWCCHAFQGGHRDVTHQLDAARWIAAAPTCDLFVVMDHWIGSPAPLHCFVIHASSLLLQMAWMTGTAAFMFSYCVYIVFITVMYCGIMIFVIRLSRLLQPLALFCFTVHRQPPRPSSLVDHRYCRRTRWSAMVVEVGGGCREPLPRSMLACWFVVVATSTVCYHDCLLGVIAPPLTSADQRGDDQQARCRRGALHLHGRSPSVSSLPQWPPLPKQHPNYCWGCSGLQGHQLVVMTACWCSRVLSNSHRVSLSPCG